MGNRPGRGCKRAVPQRRFEGNRLAKDFQIQAYAQALAATALAEQLAEQTSAASSATSSEKRPCQTQGGIAA
jgi:hypothetical protein